MGRAQESPCGTEESHEHAMPPVLALTGATAAGKSAVAVRLALVLNAEIISADSRQVYRGLDIGTAKPEPEELRAVPHHCIDICEPSETYSAGRFFSDAVRLVRDIRARGKDALIVGGTGLYLQVLADGLFDAPEVDADLRAKLTRDLRELGPRAVYDRLRTLDPDGAEAIPWQNTVRVLRALEICLQTGEPFSRVRRERHRSAPFALDAWVLQRGRADLYARIDARADGMVRRGLVEEVRNLLSRGADPAWVSMQAVGYKEAVAYIHSTCTFDVMCAQIRQNTRRFAKRQLTWFRRMPALRAIDAESGDSPDELAERLLPPSRTTE